MLLFIFGCFIATAGADASAQCQLELSPPAVVVEYGDSFTANCSSSIKGVGMGWESPQGGVSDTPGVSFLKLQIDSVKVWKMAPKCYIRFNDDDYCIKDLPVTVYKTPDSVTLRQAGQMGVTVAGQMYGLQCDVVNVAPAKDLTVYWHKGNQIVFNNTFEETSFSPVNKSSVLNMTFHPDDDGARVWCEAKLNFLPAGSPLPKMQSESHKVTVLYPPIFNVPENETLEVPAEGKIMLSCSAKGNLMPLYSWKFPVSIKQLEVNQSKSQLILTRALQFPGTYTCSASNYRGTTTKHFTLIEAPRNRSTFAAILGSFVFLGVVLFAAGLFFVTPDGTFSLNKGGYLRGQPAPSGPV